MNKDKMLAKIEEIQEELLEEQGLRLPKHLDSDGQIIFQVFGLLKGVIEVG